MHLFSAIALAISLHSSVSSGIQNKPVVSTADFKVAGLAFMAGAWEGKFQNAVIAETWMSPKAGCLLGMMREDMDGKTLVREFEVIEEGPSGITMTFDHFNADMSAIPNRKLARKLVSLKDGEAVFEYSNGEDIQKLTYRKVGTDTLLAIIEQTRASKSNKIEISMKRKS